MLMNIDESMVVNYSCHYFFCRVLLVIKDYENIQSILSKHARDTSRFWDVADNVENH